MSPDTLTLLAAPFLSGIREKMTETYGVSVFAEEAQGCHCGGVAVLGPEKRPVAALWISGMARRLPKTELLSSIRTLQETARLLEKALAAQAVRPHIENLHSAPVKAALVLFKGHLRKPVKHEELARLCHASYSTLRNAFRRETGMSPGAVPTVPAPQRGSTAARRRDKPHHGHCRTDRLLQPEALLHDFQAQAPRLSAATRSLDGNSAPYGTTTTKKTSC